MIRCNCCSREVRRLRPFTLDRERSDSVEVCGQCYQKLYDVAMELRIHAGYLALDIVRNGSGTVQNDTFGTLVVKAGKE